MDTSLDYDRGLLQFCAFVTVFHVLYYTYSLCWAGALPNCHCLLHIVPNLYIEQLCWACPQIHLYTFFSLINIRLISAGKIALHNANSMTWTVYFCFLRYYDATPYGSPTKQYNFSSCRSPFALHKYHFIKCVLGTCDAIHINISVKIYFIINSRRETSKWNAEFSSRNTHWLNGLSLARVGRRVSFFRISLIRAA